MYVRLYVCMYVFMFVCLCLYAVELSYFQVVIESGYFEMCVYTLSVCMDVCIYVCILNIVYTLVCTGMEAKVSDS